MSASQYPTAPVPLRSIKICREDVIKGDNDNIIVKTTDVKNNVQPPFDNQKLTTSSKLKVGNIFESSNVCLFFIYNFCAHITVKFC